MLNAYKIIKDGDNFIVTKGSDDTIKPLISSKDYRTCVKYIIEQEEFN